MPYREVPPAAAPRELNLALFDRHVPPDARLVRGMVGAVVIAVLWALTRDLRMGVAAVVVAVVGFVALRVWFAGRMRGPKLRLANGRLMLRRGVGAPSGMVDVDQGVHIDVRDTGVRLNDVEQARITIVGCAGRLSWTLLGLRRAEALRSHIEQFLEPAGVPVKPRSEPLGGDVRAIRLKSGAVELRWSLPDRGKAALLAVLGGLLTVIITRAVGLAIVPTVAATVAVATMILLVITPSRSASRGRRARLVVGRGAWRLDHRIGWRHEQYSGTGGTLEAMYVFSTDVPGGRRAIELRSDGKPVTTIGDGLTEPELRFIIERIREATTSPNPPRLDPTNP